MIHWHVCTTGINQEALANNGLKSKGIESYYPTGKRIVRHARQQKVKIFPVFSRYIFVKDNISNAECFNAILSTDGIISIMSNNWLPVIVSDEIIEEIRTRQLQGAFDIIPKHKPKKYKWSRSFQVLKELLNTDHTVIA